MHNWNDRNSNMAKIIVKNDKSDQVLYLISWKQICVIYINNIFVLFFVVLKNFFLCIKSRIDKKIGTTRQKIVRQFCVLSSNADNLNCHEKNGMECYDNKSVCPQTQNPELGEHKFIMIKHIRFHYVEKGEQNERVVLMLHGFPDCFFGWRNQINILSQTHRVIALDLKGFNDSDRPLVRCGYKPDRICYELKCFIDALGIKSVSLIGHDIGALLGWIFTLKYPDYVNKFFSISTPHPNLFWKPLRGSVLSKYWFNMIQIPILPEKELSKNNSFIHETCKHLIENVSSKEINQVVKNKTNNLMETYEYIFSRPEDYVGGLHYFRNLMLYRVKSSLTIRCPCILIFGTRCPNFGLDMAIRSSEYCDNPLVKIIDSAGYWSHQTHAKEVNKILIQYLGGEKKSFDQNGDLNSINSTRRGLVGRVMDKVYNVGHQYVM